MSLDEFENYVAKRNNKEDRDEIMREFRNIDTSGDGYIQFLEFLRASCNNSAVYMPDELSLYDKLRIFEIVEFRHITKEDQNSYQA